MQKKLSLLWLLSLALLTATPITEAWANGELTPPTTTTEPQSILKHNQLGYHPNAEKLLWVSGVTPTPLEPTKFVIRNPQKKNALIAPEGMKVGRPYGELLNPSLILLDATTLKKEGVFDVYPYGGYWKPQPASPKYQLRVNSGLFLNQIAPSTRTFFYNRSGQFLGDATSNLLLEAGHTKPQSLQGGWYEGPNYHQHIVSTAWASTQLMNAYMVLGQREGWEVKLAYPSSEPKTTELPDLLHEAQVGLQWILKLQQPNGSFLSGTYSQADIAPTVKPANDKSLRLALPTSPFATAIGVATLARAAQAYKETDPSFAVSCLLAAKKGIDYLPTQLKTSSVPTISFGSPAVGSTNEVVATLHEPYWSQAPKSMTPALYWAYTALAEATGDESLKETALSFVPKLKLDVATWENPVPFVVSYYTHTTGLSSEERDQLLALADAKKPLLQSILNPMVAPVNYTEKLSLPLPKDNFEWVNLGILWAEAYHASQNPTYLAASTDVFNYLMGFNQWNQTFITGNTAISPDIQYVRNPCHQLSRTTKTLFPGFLVKGFPNNLATTTLPFQDNSRQCEFTGTSLMGQGQFVYWLALLHKAYNPNGLVVKKVIAPTVKKPLDPNRAKQIFPLIKRS